MSGSSQLRRCPSCRAEFSRPISLDMSVPMLPSLFMLYPNVFMFNRAALLQVNATAFCFM
jgi:hypothetical protein